jgi:glyoxylase-like metal-dependent hydrolase (beta-lactamase superfamily II)
VDPGPASTLDTLRAELRQLGVSVADISTVLLTHIHLDHAGATGSLVRENPRLRVLVSERGARHVADPTRLLDSARRLYGDALNPLFGVVEPVPAGSIDALSGGERLRAAGRTVAVAYAPGHAKHHVAFLDEASGTAFVGDTCGVRAPGESLVLPVTPPPDIDLEAWSDTLDRIEAWRPERLFLTHFGAAGPSAAHIAQLRERLASWAARVRDSLDGEADDDAQRAAAFARDVEHATVRELGADAAWYIEGAEPALSWYGLARYWRGRSPPGG